MRRFIALFVVAGTSFALSARGGTNPEGRTLAEARQVLGDAGVAEDAITVAGPEAVMASWRLCTSASRRPRAHSRTNP